LLPIPISALLASLFAATGLKTGQVSIVFSKFLAAFLAALISFATLNDRREQEERFHKTSRGFTLNTSLNKSLSTLGRSQPWLKAADCRLDSQGAIVHKPSPDPLILAGRSLDLTIFALVRAADIVVNYTWDYRKTQRIVRRTYTYGESFIESITAPGLFAVSSSIIMWAWFYTPHRLPRSYNRWISSAAQVDDRLIQALRECRYGNFIYGKDTGIAPLLEGMCRDLGLPKVWGDPSKTVPIPCELVHSGAGASCEWHAITRFARTWKFAMQTYLPLNLLLLVRRKPPASRITRACLNASQSSAFLGMFVALFYYGVCLSRTRLGPKLFSSNTVSPMMWDGGFCVGTGCIACGWSILLEKASRRPEIAFFVAPRAISTVLPRRYDRKVRLIMTAHARVEAN